MSDAKLVDLMSDKAIWSSEYLYGVKGSYFKNMTYEEAIRAKIKLAKQLKNSIVESLHSEANSKIDYETYVNLCERVKNIDKAIVHNELLLKDMEV